MNPPVDARRSVGDLFDLTGRVALVTGGTGYLGSAISTALAEAGATVVISSRERSRAEAAARALPPVDGTTHLGVELDYRDDASLDSALSEITAAAGKLDILVNNGHDPTAEDWTSATREQFNRQLENATGYFLLSRLVHDHAVQRQAAASIILVGSMYGVVGSYPDAYEDVCPASPVAYHALKGGIVHMTRHLAVYWARHNVRVNCLCPGPFPKPDAPADMVRRLCQKSPMGRMGLPHELQGAVLLLASDAGSYITGQCLLVDGGWTAW